MPICISLLRGINVGGHRKIKMTELKALYESLGYERVTTYIQSGNVVFSSRGKNTAPMERKLQAGIERQFGHEVDVFVYGVNAWREMITENPFGAGSKIDPKRMVVSFLAAAPEAAAREALAQVESGKDEVRFRGRFAYMYFPDGYGQTKLSNPVMERKLKTRSTARNWNTVNKLLELAQEAT